MANILDFNPIWRVDPPPDWYRIIAEQLDKATLAEIAVSQLELNADILKAQTKAVERNRGILNRAIAGRSGKK